MTSPSVNRRHEIGMAIIGIVFCFVTTCANTTANSDHASRILSAKRRQAAHKAAADAFLTAEALVWHLEGEALRETRRILRSKEVQQLKRDGDGISARLEEQLRRMIRQQRSVQLKAGAERLINLSDSRTQALVRDSAGRQGLEPTDFVLDWLTYDAAFDFAMLTSLWRNRGNLRSRQGRTLAESLFPNRGDVPELDRGVTVLSQNHAKVIVSLYGASVVQEVLHRPFGLNKKAATIRWKSNYESLRSVILGGENSPVHIERLQRRPDGWRISYRANVEEYLRRGFNTSWAAMLFLDDPGVLAKLVGEGGTQTATGLGRPHTGSSLEVMFPSLAPSAPVVETETGSASGFLVRYGSVLALVTNKHVVRDASTGFRLIFPPSDRVSGADSLAVQIPATAVLAAASDSDLALISLESVTTELHKREITPLTLADNEPQVGAEVFAIGNPGAGPGGVVLQASLAPGYVSGIREQPEVGRVIQVTVPINPGNSGGPLFDMTGRVIGVVTFIVRAGQGGIALEGLNFATSLPALRGLLDGSAPRLDREALAELVGTAVPRSDREAKFRTRLVKVMDQLEKRGFRLYGKDFAGSSRFVVLRPNDHTSYKLDVRRGEQYVAVAVGHDERTSIKLGLLEWDGSVVASDVEGGSVAVAHVEGTRDESVTAVVLNAGDRTATVAFVMTTGAQTCTRPGERCGASGSGLACCSGGSCVTGAVQGVYTCADHCETNSDCQSGCCAPLSNSGNRVCSAPRFCGR